MLSISQRKVLKNYIENMLDKVNISGSSTDLCDAKSSKLFFCFFKIFKKRGEGSYGAVYEMGSRKEDDNKERFAVKFAYIPEKAVLSKSVQETHEYFFLKKVSKLVEDGICPNLPLLLGDYTCGNCDKYLKRPKGVKHKNHKCLVFLSELAHSDLQDAQGTLPTHVWENCLFQIGAALHAIHHHLWLTHMDCRRANILVYKVPKGGYWKYTILGQDYYLPNLGYLFVLADFGLAESYHALEPFFDKNSSKERSIGNRALIVNGKTSLVPVEDMKGKMKKTFVGATSDSAMYPDQDIQIDRKGDILDDVLLSRSQEKFLKSRGYSDMLDEKCLLDPYVQFPLESKLDTQMLIHIFMKKVHRDIPGSLFKSLRKYYLGIDEGLKGGNFYNFGLKESKNYQLEKIHTGYFIRSFFKKLRQKPKSAKIIESYSIS